MTTSSEGSRASVSALVGSMLWPEQREKLPPCGANCASGGDVRAWIGVIAQRGKLGLSDDEALAAAWRILAEKNPFPATMGRVCPHPCETDCNRRTKDGPVAINALERFLGDWALARHLPLPKLETPDRCPESIGVIGAGPAGLSFAYQMARRGYRVTIYERDEKPGGMLQFGIPEYRLPEDVLTGEIDRILDVGVELHLNTAIGGDIELSTLRVRHSTIFVGIGAGRGLRLGIPGETGSGSWTGTGYLARVNRRIPVELGARVVVVGGGNTAIDAARTARRAGAEVTVLYRRTRQEMPAIDAEVEDALAEGVRLEFLAAPVEIRRDNGTIRSVVVRRMALGEPDASGRRAPVPIPGSEYEMSAQSVIAAVSQQPDWDGLLQMKPASAWLEASPTGECVDGMWTGGDTRGLGLAGLAIGQGRMAAESAHARLRGLASPPASGHPTVTSGMVKPDFFAGRKPVSSPRRPSSEWLALPDLELDATIGAEELLQEVERCFSCGLCFGCEQCFMFCNAEGVVPLENATRGAYFALHRDRCLACGKCIDLCPCGFLSPS